MPSGFTRTRSMAKSENGTAQKKTEKNFTLAPCCGMIDLYRA